MDIIETLMNFSLTRQEAVIYITLLSEGALTGYEVSKVSGISRSNSYTSLASLVEKGASNIIEDSATKYVPVGIDEFCSNKISELKRLKDFLKENVSDKKEESTGYITIKGEKHIFNKIVNMVSNSVERIYISASENLLKSLIAPLSEAIKNGLKVVIISDSDINVDGAIIYKAKRPPNQIRLIVDTSSILTGEISENSACLFSNKKNLVDLFKDTLKNEIKLIELGKL